MARSTMGDLIARTRTLISDTGTPPVFTDDQMQDALDFWRQEMRNVLLRSVPSFSPGGAVSYLDYYSDFHHWESDVVLQTLSYASVTATSAELLVGHWRFAQQPDGISLRATGKTYDIYAAAADLLDSWAAQVKLDFSFQAGTDRYERQGKFTMLTEMAAKYRALALPHFGRMIQTDATPDHTGGGVTYPSGGSNSAL